MKFRSWNRFRAAMGGYFWLPCPLCGQMTGGHEWRDVDGKSSMITTERGDGFRMKGAGICRDCTLAGKGDPAWLETR